MNYINLIRYSGDSLIFKLDLFKDLYGGYIYFSMKDLSDDTIVISEKKYVSMPLTMTDEMVISSELTKSLLGNFIYDIRFKDHKGNIETCAYGEIDFETPITVSM